MIKCIVRDIKFLLGSDTDQMEDDADVIFLWDETGHLVQHGINYSHFD